jgi:cell division protein FtsL
MSMLATMCMMLAFSPVFTQYNVYEPIVLGFPLWFLVWFLVAAIFVWIFVLYAVTKLLPDNKNLESIWESVAKQKEKAE